MSGYQVRPYQPGDEKGILQLFNEVFAEGDENFQSRTLAQWRWEYQENPAGRQVMIAVTDTGRVIAHYACLPAAVNVRGERCIAGQGVDSMVHPDYRRGLKREGPFLAVARAYFERWGNARVCAYGFGYPNKRAFRIGVRVLKYVPVFQPIPTLYRNFFDHPHDDDVAPEAVGRANVVEIDQFGEEFDQLWEKLAAHYPFAFIRDSQYLNWRYGQSPELTYRRFAIRDDRGLRGWFVTRAQWQGLPILALADLFCHPEDEVSLGLALRGAAKAGRESEQARVEAWLPQSSRLFQLALERGFGTEPSQYVLCIMLYRDEPELDWVRNHWYYTIGDSDVF